MKPLLILGLALWLPATALGQQEAAWQGKTARQWAEQLTHGDVRLQWYAAYALGQIGPQALGVIDPLVGILPDRGRDEYVRDCAGWALGRIGSGAKPVLDVLIETLRSTLPSVRRNSSRALGNIGAAAGPAIPGLTGLLQDRDATVRANAAVALWRIGRHANTIPVLVEMSRRPEGPGPYQAVVALGRVASQAEKATPALVAALRHADPDVRRAAARGLGRIGPPAIAALKLALADPDQEVRRSAVEALRWIGPAAKAAEPVLIEALRDTDDQIRRSAARALGKIRGQQTGR